MRFLGLPGGIDVSTGPAGTGAHPKKEAEWWRPFLTALSATGNVSAACRAVGVGRRLVYKHRERFPRFASRWDDAVDEAIDHMEAEVFRRAVG